MSDKILGRGHHQCVSGVGRGYRRHQEGKMVAVYTKQKQNNNGARWQLYLGKPLTTDLFHVVVDSLLIEAIVSKSLTQQTRGQGF